jgi:CMP/dCMP kinase
MIVLVCGFSGSGKSVLVESISKKFKINLVHTSDILKKISSKEPLEKIDYKNTKMNKGWYEKSNLDQIRKEDKNIDLLLDQFLLKIINKEKNVVMDSWALPYLSKKGIKIWLHADVKERAKRLSLRNKTSYEEALKNLKKKDGFSKRHFKKIYGFSLGKDLSVFNYVIDTNNKTIKDVEKEVFDILKKQF